MSNLHVAALSTKHARLEEKLAYEAQAALPDSLRIAALKKAKLRLKEQIVRPL